MIFQKKFIRIAYYSSSMYFFCETADNSEIVPRIIEQKLSFISRNQWPVVVVVCCSCWEQTFDVSFTSVKKQTQKLSVSAFHLETIEKVTLSNFSFHHHHHHHCDKNKKKKGGTLHYYFHWLLVRYRYLVYYFLPLTFSPLNFPMK